MKLSIIQFDISWENRSASLGRIEHFLDRLEPATELVILPEMFTTGFSMKPGELSEPPYSDTFHWMLNVSLKGNFGICGSYIVKDNNNFFNRWIMVTPDRRVWSYDKRHLFTMSGEENAFTRGTSRITFTFRDTRICPNICYDLRFPVWSRNMNDYDLLINSANWPEKRHDVWLTLLKARAVENQCFVAGANRVGIDGEGIRYRGDSLIISPKGKILARGAHDTECIVTADISLKELSEFRKKFPVLGDADNFTLLI